MSEKTDTFEGRCVIRLTPAMLRDGTAVETIERALKARRKERPT